MLDEEAKIESENINPDRTETIKLLFEWNKWLVAVETAAIAALGFLAKDHHGAIATLFGILTIFTFVLAIALSSFFLLNLPYMISENRTDNNSRLTNQQVPFRWEFQRRKWYWGDTENWRVGKFTMLITRLFVTGIMLFALTFMFALI